jgi:hypothetical protein
MFLSQLARAAQLRSYPGEVLVHFYSKVFVFVASGFVGEMGLTSHRSLSIRLARVGAAS